MGLFGCGEKQGSIDMVMSNSLKNAHRRISQYMIRREVEEFPVNLCHIDESANVLVVGVPDPAAVGRYRDLLRDRLGDARATFVGCGAAVRHAKKKDWNRPLVGGLYITTPDPGGSGLGTITVAATQNGKAGFVTAGHVAGQVGATMYQPRFSDKNDWTAGTASTVSDYKGRAKSDSAFILDGTGGQISARRIWKAANALYTVRGAVGVPAPGTGVFMQGAALVGERSGVIAAVDVTVTFEDGGVLTGQGLAAYESREGDSGAPVYLKAADPQVDLIGLNVGATAPEHVDPAPDPARNPPAGNGTYAIISPWAGIAEELNVLL